MKKTIITPLLISAGKKTSCFWKWLQESVENKACSFLKSRSLLIVNDCFKKLHNAVIGVFLQTLIIIFAYACQKDIQLNHSPNFKLQFSTDSLIFDTIFSGIGSVTKRFKVYNKSSKDVEIDRIYLAKSSHSNYNINIDGNSSKSSRNNLLESNDSMYVFVEVLIDTDKDALLVKDSVVFVTNGNQQDVKLLAWGQDVVFIDGKKIKSDNWTSKKPYLIYNSVLLDTNEVLHIEAGAKLYFHRDSRMYIAGTLEIDGTIEDPVVLQGDRLEEPYNDVPGQWEGIWLLNGSKDNYINNAEIKNSLIGIIVDTLASSQKPTLSLYNTKIQHCSSVGILARGSTIFAANCLISDCGYHTLALKIGGDYNFYNCTFANYWNNSIRNTPSVILNNYYVSNDNELVIRDLTHAGFYNCIIYGDRQNEIFIDKNNKGVLNYEFENCLIKYDEDANLSSQYLEKCINLEPEFVDAEKYLFGLDTISPAINKASRAIIDLYPDLLYYDIENKSRTKDIAPDIGAYEFN